MVKTAIVLTTINNPTKAVKDFSKLKDYTLFVSGDNKTPDNWSLKNAKFLSMQNQRKQYPKLSSLVAENHYSRKNIAYIDAIQSGTEFIYETDDDNLPYDFFPNFLKKETVGLGRKRAAAA